MLSRTKDAPLACSPDARRRHEKRISRTRIRPFDQNVGPERDRYRKPFKQEPIVYPRGRVNFHMSGGASNSTTWIADDRACAGSTASASS